MLIIKHPPTPPRRQDLPSSVPLKSVHVEAHVLSFAADVTITQVFRNDEKTPIEAVYCFPIEEQAAIYSFTAQIDDRHIVAQLKEKKQAQQEYNDALQQGHGAYLLEQDDKSHDNFIVNVGALPPGKECTIIISYVTELDFFQGSIIRFVVPTTIAPRYNPDKGAITAPAGTTSKYVQSTPYRIDFRCHIDKLGRSQDELITRISSPSHPIEVDFSQADNYLVTFAQENTHLDRDILLNIELASKRANTIAALESTGVMAVFTPTEDDCRQGSSAATVNEFLFVIDCSGSMRDENKIGLARQSMLLFLKSLPIDSHFNIIRFGSTYQPLFPSITAIYNEENARKAEQLINTGMEADLGGTELLRPLQWIAEHSPNEGRSRQVFLLTDGEVANVSAVLDLCRSMATSTRIFSFGLGRSPSRSLVKGLARATNGKFVFIPPNAKVDIYVGEQLQKALQPSITDVQVHWNLGNTEVQSAPTTLPPIYANDRLILYALLSDASKGFDHNSTVELRTNADHRQIGMAQIDRIPHLTRNQTIPRLAAKALILELQHRKDPSLARPKPSVGSKQPRFEQLTSTTTTTTHEPTKSSSIEQQIIELSLKYQILSPHTAFVGVEKRIDGNNAEMVVREVPIEISADDQHLLQQSNFQPMSLMRCAAPIQPSSFNRSSSTVMSFECYQTSALSSGSRGRVGFSAIKRKAMAPERDVRRSDFVDYSSDEPVVNVAQSSRRDDVWPSNDEDIVRHLINKQNFTGLWTFDSTIIEKLTGKPFSTFHSIDPALDASLLTSLIIVHLLETRFSSYSSLWHGIVQKARKAINNLLNTGAKNIDYYFAQIQQQI